jgi:hypothetical protein
MIYISFLKITRENLMMPCNICSPADQHGLRQPFDAGGQMLKGLKQLGKTKYSPNGIKYERIYVCQDCGVKWKMIGSLGFSPSDKDVPVLEIVGR